MSNKITQKNFRGFKVKYHRNGMTGEGFYLCEFQFDWSRGRPTQHMLAVVFEAPGRVAVLSDCIAERWSGPDFETALREAIAAAEKAQPEFIYG